MNKKLGSVIKDVKTVCEHGDILRDTDTIKSVLELLEELKFRREHTDLLENSDATKNYVHVDGRVLRAGQKYRHFKKGSIYVVVIPCVYDTDDMREYVIYRGGDNKRRMWARPIDEFMSPVDTKKYTNVNQYYRFELVEDDTDV